MNHNVVFDPEIGQLWPAERQLLFDTIIERKPRVVFEVGAWRGAGSTLIIATALRKLGQGHLYTCEPDLNLFETARKLFSDASWHPFITLINSTSKDAIEYLKTIQAIPEAMFFDGPEDPNVGFEDFKELENYVQNGCMFVAHDWCLDRSIKVTLLRPYLEANSNWAIRKIIGPPESVGLVVAVKTNETK